MSLKVHIHHSRYMTAALANQNRWRSKVYPEFFVHSNEFRVLSFHTIGRLQDQLGVQGLNLLMQLEAFIPPTFCGYRTEYTKNILNTAVSSCYTTEDIQHFLQNLAQVPSRVKHSCGASPPIDLLWEVTHSHKQPYTISMPLQLKPASCVVPLHTHNPPVSVISYTKEGPLPCHVNYRYEMYGKEDTGYTYYSDHIQPFTPASRVCYVERTCTTQWAASA